jgi:hypothetical protein
VRATGTSRCSCSMCSVGVCCRVRERVLSLDTPLLLSHCMMPLDNANREICVLDKLFARNSSCSRRLYRVASSLVTRTSGVSSDQRHGTSNNSLTSTALAQAQARCRPGVAPSSPETLRAGWLLCHVATPAHAQAQHLASWHALRSALTESIYSLQVFQRPCGVLERMGCEKLWGCV